MTRADDPNGRTAVYRLFDGHEVLLYVGLARNPDVRFAYHSKKKEWWPDVVVRHVTWYDTRNEAAEHELEAIQSETPKYNGLRERKQGLIKPAADREEIEGPDIRILLADVLHERRMSQVELAERIGVHPTNLNRLINGQFSMLKRSTITAICLELDIQPGDWIVYSE